MTNCRDVRRFVATLFLTLLTTLAGAAPEDLVPVPLKWAPIAGAGSYRVEVQTEAGKALVTKDTVDPALALNLAPGNYKVRISSLNRFGKVDSASPWTPMTVRKLTAPVVKSVQPPEVEEGSGFTLRVTASAEEGVAYTLEGTKGPLAPTAVRHPKADQWELDFAAADPGAFDLRAVAPSGKTGVLAGALTVRPYPAVTLTPGDPVAMVEGEALTLTVGALGVDGQTVWTLEGGPAPVVAASVARQADRWTLTFPALVPGTYTLRAVARTGKVGEVGGQVKVDPYPEVELSGGATVKVSAWETIPVTLKATGVDPRARWFLTVGGEQVSANRAIRGAEGNWSLEFPPQTPGTYAVGVVTSGGKEGRVDGLVEVPRFTLTNGETHAVEGEPLTWTVKATGVDPLARWELLEGPKVVETLSGHQGPTEDQWELTSVRTPPQGAYGLGVTPSFGERLEQFDMLYTTPHPPVVDRVSAVPLDDEGSVRLTLEGSYLDRAYSWKVLRTDGVGEMVFAGTDPRRQVFEVYRLKPGTYNLVAWMNSSSVTVSSQAFTVLHPAPGIEALLTRQPEAAAERPMISLMVKNLTDVTRVWAVAGEQSRELRVKRGADDRLDLSVPDDLAGGTYDLLLKTDEGKQAVLKGGLTWPLALPEAGTGELEVGASLDGLSARLDGGPSETLPHRFRAVDPGNHVLHLAPAYGNPKLYEGAQELNLEVTSDVGLKVWALVDHQRTPVTFSGFPEGSLVDWGQGPRAVAAEPVLLPWGQYHFRVVTPSGAPFTLDQALVGTVAPLDLPRSSMVGVIPYRTIAVKGNVSDWDGVDPFLVEAVPEARAGNYGTDMLRGWLTRDSQYLYYRISLGKGVPVRQGNMTYGLNYGGVDTLVTYDPGKKTWVSKFWFGVDTPSVETGGTVVEMVHGFEVKVPLEGFRRALKDDTRPLAVRIFVLPPSIDQQVAFGNFQTDPVSMVLEEVPADQPPVPQYHYRLDSLAAFTDAGATATGVSEASEGKRTYFHWQGSAHQELVWGLPQDLGSGSEESLSFWVRLDGTQDRVNLISLGQAEEYTLQTLWLDSAGNLVLQGTGLLMTTNALLNPGQWSALTLVRKGREMQLFLQGKPVAKGTLSKEGSPTFHRISLGESNWHSSLPFRGDLDDLRIYDRALTDKVVAQLANPASRSQGDVVKGPLAGLVTDIALPKEGLRAPQDLAVGPDESVYVADSEANRIWKIPVENPQSLALFAGTGGRGSLDTELAGSTFDQPSGMAFDPQGKMALSDKGGQLLRRIDPAKGLVTTLSGSGKPGFQDSQNGAVRFNRPQGIVYDDEGNLFVADSGNHSIRKLSKLGFVSTYEGTGKEGSRDRYGAIDQNSATFKNPTGLAIDREGNLYIADTGNNKIRKITPDGVVSTLAGTGSSGSTDGLGSQATFNQPTGLAFGPDGLLYVADTGNNLLRAIAPDGTVTTIAGSPKATSSFGAQVKFDGITGLAFDRKGFLFISEKNAKRVRRME